MNPDLPSSIEISLELGQNLSDDLLVHSGPFQSILKILARGLFISSHSYTDRDLADLKLKY
jgi:hypothetical protein